MQERIGIDKTVIAGFRIKKIDRKKLLAHENVTFEPQGVLTYLLEDGSSFRWLKIEDFSVFGRLVAGTRNTSSMKQDYSRIEISVWSPKSGNLQNLTMSQYHEKLKTVFEYLWWEYGVLVDDRDMRFNLLELNCTFALENNFQSYHRVIRLMMYNLPNNFLKVTEYAKVNKKDFRLESETFFRGNQRMEIKIYDKTRQLKETRGICLDKNVMRVEIVLKKSEKIREVFGTNRVAEITDPMIRNYYFGMFCRTIEKKYFSWREKNSKILRDMVTYWKDRHPKKWHRELLAECRDYEQKNQIPLLLDINDLLQVLKTLESNRHYKRVENAVLNACREDDTFLQDDSEKMSEINEKIKNAYMNDLLEEASSDKNINGEVA